MTPTAWICVTCGIQHAATAAPPPGCAVCEDERQYVNHAGQRWTTLAELRTTHRADLRPERELLGIGSTPSFGIGQRALLVPDPNGNVLWDCVALLDDEIGAELERRGGLAAIAVSHAHYHTTFVEWSRAFGGVPVYVHADDREWVMRPDPCVEYWDGDELELSPGRTLLRLGGHFAGGQVMHWRKGAAGRGALLVGDVVQVAMDRRWVSFMYSYPNYIPLAPRAVQRIVARLEPYAYDDIYGAWWERNVIGDAKAAVARSADRYLRAVTDSS